MTRGRELPVNSKVRRQLFPEDAPAKPWDSKKLNKEYIAQTLHNDIILKGKKWNFDFFNDIPTGGLIKWCKERNYGLWIGTRPRPSKRVNSGGGMKSVSADERSKKRRLPQHVVDERRSFIEMDNLINYGFNQYESATGIIIDIRTHPGSDQGPLEVPRCRGVNWSNSLYELNLEPTADFGDTRRAPDRAQVNTDHHQSLYNLPSTQPALNYSAIKETKEEEKEGAMEEEIEELNGTSSNNVVTNNDLEMKKKDEVELLTKDDFNNLRISDITDTNMEDEEMNDTKDINELNNMKELNEVTPKNAKSPGSPSKNVVTVQSVKEKARRKLYNYRFDI